MGIDKIKGIEDHWPVIPGNWIISEFGELGRGVVDLLEKEFQKSNGNLKASLKNDLAVAIGRIIEAAYLQGRFDKSAAVVKHMTDIIQKIG